MGKGGGRISLRTQVHSLLLCRGARGFWSTFSGSSACHSPCLTTRVRDRRRRTRCRCSEPRLAPGPTPRSRRLHYRHQRRSTPLQRESPPTFHVDDMQCTAVSVALPNPQHTHKHTNTHTYTHTRIVRIGALLPGLLARRWWARRRRPRLDSVRTVCGQRTGGLSAD